MDLVASPGPEPELLQQLVHCLAAALGFEFALVGIVEAEGSQVSTLVDTQSGPGGSTTYPLFGTPCSDTLVKGVHVVADGVALRYANDSQLTDFGARSYAGARFDDPLTGRAGLVVAISRAPIEDATRAAEIVRTFANSARAARTAQSAVLAGVIADEALRGTGQAFVVATKDGRIDRESPTAPAFVFGCAPQATTLAERFAECAPWVATAAAARERASGRVKLTDARDPSARRVGEIDVVPVSDGSGRTIVLMRDVTRSLEREERFELALDASGAGLWDWSIESGTLVTSAHYMAMLGEEARETRLSILDVASRLHPGDFAATFQALTRAQTCPEQRYDVEFRMRCKDGSYKWLRSSGRVVERGSSGEPLRMIGYHLDIDARRRSEQERGVLEGHMRLLFEHTPAAIAMFDRDMRYVVASRGWYTQYGLGDESIIGRSHYDVFPTVPERWKEHHRRALAGEVLTSDRDAFEREDGSTTNLSWAIHPWRNASDEIGGIVMFTQVIDEQVRHEDSLRDARDAAIAASRARGDFLANMSHEIRTPMTAILGFTDLLESDPENRAEHVETIRRNGRHLLEIVNSLLDLSKIDAGRMTVERLPVDVGRLFDDIARTFASRAEERGLELSITRAATAPTTIGSDPLRLRQILGNLVGNALKFTPKGSVAVRLGAPTDDGTRIAFEVEDTGIGMTAEQLDKVFEPFVQGDGSTTRRFGGTGLGLCIAKRLTALLGGELVVRSTPGVGTTFRLELPLVSLESESSAAVDAPPAALPKRNLEGMRVLLAEDGADNRRLIGVLLARAGAHAQAVENGALVAPELERARAAGTPYDAVLMDMQMPHVDGYSATAALRAAGFELPVIALTAHAMAGDRERCLDAGCDDYLAKPIDRLRLEDVLARAMARARST
jgi:PAS domain S-box-containing protein